MQRNKIKNKILSNESISRISMSGYWVSENHGSKIIEYFEDNGFEYEYANSILRKKIVKNYLMSNIENVLDNLELLDGKDIFRTIYIKELPEGPIASLGRFWSTRADTNPCVSVSCPESLEVTFKTTANSNLINYYETALSRLDYVFGEREQEVQIKDIPVKFSISNLL